MDSTSIGVDEGASMLLRAMSIAGGLEPLAQHLRVPKKQLDRWVAGKAETPHGVFLRVVDFLRNAP